MGMKKIAQSKAFWKMLITLVVPIAVQAFLSSAVNSADVVMIGKVGQTELSAVSLANQFQFLLSGFAFGLNSGITILASQYWGKKDLDAIQIVLGISLKTAAAVSLIIAAGSMLIPEKLMTIYTSEKELITIGAQYLRLIGPAFLLWGLSTAYETFLRSLEHAAKATAISSCALIMNVLLNAVFIFGLLGFPRMEVRGAALATTAARGMEFLLCVLDFFSGKTMKFRPSLMFRRNKVLTGDYFRYTLPATLGDISWSLAFSTYAIIMGHLSADVVAANSVATTVRDLCTVFAYAVGGGACVMIGITIGEGRMEDAKAEADLISLLSLALGILTGGVILLLRPFILDYFDLTERAEEYLSFMLLISSYYIIGQIMNTLWIGGIFRSGGNTKWGLICDTVTMWCVSVPVGFISAFLLKLPPMTVYFILCLDEFWKLPIVIRHYRSYVWLRNLTREDLHPDTLPGS